MRRAVLALLLVGCGDERAVPFDAVVDSVVDAVGVDASGDAEPRSICGDGVVEGAEQCDDGMAGLSGDGCSSTCRTETLTFRSPTREIMVHRRNHALAFDHARNRTVLFGGETLVGGVFTPSFETWELDSSGWHQIVTPTAPAIQGHLFYDGTRVLLVGAEMWAWNGVTWTQLSSATMPTGLIAGAVYDPQRHVGVLFSTTGVWEWGGTTWTHVEESNRGYNVMAYAGNGQVARITSAQVELWNGTTWTVVPASLPSPVAATYDAAHGRLVATSYDSTQWPIAMNHWTGSEWTRVATPAQAPFERSSPLVFDDVAGVVRMHSGGGYGRGDTWSWDGAAWTQAYGSVPPPRFSSALTFDATRGRVTMFGGNGQCFVHGDQWTYRAGTWAPLVTPTAPSPRIPLAWAFDEKRGKMIVVGGQLDFDHQQRTSVRDLWELDADGWTQRIAPTALMEGESTFYGAAYDRARGYTLIAGAGHTWTWDGTTLVEVAPAPAEVSWPALAHDARRGVTVMSSTYEVRMLYEWDGAAWVARGEEVAGGPMFYDPVRAKVVKVGRTADTFYEWDGTSLVAVASAPAEDLGEFVYDPTSGGWLSFGLPSSWDTWTARWESGEVAERCDGTDLDLDGLVRCADPDCWWRCTPQCPPRATCDSAAPHCGDGTCSELEDTVLCPADCP